MYKEITHNNTFLAIQRLLRGLKNEVDKYRGNQSELRLFDPLYSKEELMKVKKLSKGTVLFSEPTVINEWLTEEVHDKLVRQFLGEHKKKTTPKRSAFHLQWRIYVKQPRFEVYTKHVNVNELIKGSGLGVQVDLYHSDNKEVVKAIDFDLKATTVAKKLYELNLLTTIFDDHQVVCVFPSPKTKQGKDLLQQSKENSSDIVFKKFRLEF